MRPCNLLIMSCIFCKIAKKETKAEIVYEDEKIIAFKDINPIAPFHLLLIPKRHIQSVAELKEKDKLLMGELILRAKKIAKEKGFRGYRLFFNVGREGGQVIDHLHLHLTSGKLYGVRN